MNVAAISRFVLRHKALVAGIWLLVTILAIGLMPWSLGNLSEEITIPDTESSSVAETAWQVFGSDGTASPLVLVVTLPTDVAVESPQVATDWGAIETAVRNVAPTARILSWASSPDSALVGDDQRTMFGYVFLPTAGEGLVGQDAVIAAVDDLAVTGEPLQVTGRYVLETGESDAESSGVLVETLIGGVGALVVLLYVFGSALALTPLLIAAVSILGSFLAIGVLGTTMDISNIVQYMVALIGLGVAVDYSLLVVKRWREERLAGQPNQAAVQIAMETAGHAVIFSGTTVGIGLLALIAVPIPFFRGIGVGGMIIPLASVIVSITLLPVVLATVGPALDRVGFGGRKPDNHRLWEAWGRWVVRHRWWATAIGLGILGLLLIPALQLSLGSPRPDSLAGAGEPKAALTALEDAGIGAGVFDPLVILVEGDPDPTVGALTEVDGIRGVFAPTASDWRSDGVALITVVPQGSGDNAAQRDLVNDVRAAVQGLAGDPLVGGAPAAGTDFIDKVYGSFPLVLAIIGAVTFVLLVRAFRSLVLPVKALILNVLSVAAAYGVLVIVWQWGWGSDLIWNTPSTSSITDWVPIMIFAFLFGLSMDYEVFILSRMREEYDAGHSTDEAVIRGLAFTGKLVTCAALILFLAFVAMASTPQTELRIMATGLAAGILLDAIVIRTFLVPALTSLMGHWNWWLPSWLQWLAPGPERDNVSL